MTPIASTATPEQDVEYRDVVIVGAGISGIGAAYHLQKSRPESSFLIVDKLDNFGGTWRLHRYPGLRSDSDLYTFGYGFKPWKGNPIATGQEILDYLQEVIDENGLADKIRYGQTLCRADWCSEKQLWQLQIEGAAGTTHRIETRFLWMCQGYYRYEKGHMPKWDGMSDFQGQIIHPQHWPEDIELQGKRVLVIGSGATAATIIPAIADKCDHVTMLQRSPGYLRYGRNIDQLVDMLRSLEVDESWIHEIARRKILHDQHQGMLRSLQDPEGFRAELLDGVRQQLDGDKALLRHFSPDYRPWSQRILFVPDGDLFQNLRSGKASVVTDRIECFTKDGVQLESGKHLEADIVITATGFDLSVMGDIPFFVDDIQVNFANTVTYRGMMFTDVPNFVWVFGYFRSAWTMRADLVSEFVCRLLAHMDQSRSKSVTPRLRPTDKGMTLGPWIDPDNFSPNYLRRSLHLLPKCGPHSPWQNLQDYWVERKDFAEANLDDSALVYR